MYGAAPKMKEIRQFVPAGEGEGSHHDQLFRPAEHIKPVFVVMIHARSLNLDLAPLITI